MIITLVERLLCTLPLVQMLSVTAAQKDPALAGHAALTSQNATEAAALALNQPHGPHGKERALRQRISQSAGVRTTGQLRGHGAPPLETHGPASTLSP